MKINFLGNIKCSGVMMGIVLRNISGTDFSHLEDYTGPDNEVYVFPLGVVLARRTETEWFLHNGQPNTTEFNVAIDLLRSGDYQRQADTLKANVEHWIKQRETISRNRQIAK